ncbi:hypothetical protein DSL92_03105 [Billgrantia gudaonensis]|uniref:Uncharacterized protein n=1 Tax=Billgrantia gudaonensis TaxID=376427 RepID=A0A3S0NF07_9GAMM|nr:hypothetical protein DSL92_03105 [Halomonas gudaonensis]
MLFCEPQARMLSCPRPSPPSSLRWRPGRRRFRHPPVRHFAALRIRGRRHSPAPARRPPSWRDHLGQPSQSGNDGSRYRRHHLPLEEGELVEISLDGALHTAWPLRSSRAVGRRCRAKCTLRRRIDESGDYLLVVSGGRRSYGPFDLPAAPDLSLSDTGELEGESRLDGWLQGKANEHSWPSRKRAPMRSPRSDDFDASWYWRGRRAVPRGRRQRRRPERPHHHLL